MKFLGLILTIVVSLIFPGIISIVKAKIGGRKGPGLFQPLYDTLRLLRKGSIYSTTTSVVFQLAPVIYLSTVLTAVLFLPFSGTRGVLSFEGDFVFFAYLLALGKFLMIIGAMDTGSGFEGMGANREALYSMLVEPSFFILMGSLALLTDHTTFFDLYLNLHFGSYMSYLVASMGIFLLVQIAMIENSRLPVDDPKTHLELTMIHEVMVLDNSGFDMAIIQLASGLKFALYGTLIFNFFDLQGYNTIAMIGFFFLVQMGFAVIVGLLESFRARNKLDKNPQWILTLLSISLLAFLSILIMTHKVIID